MRKKIINFLFAACLVLSLILVFMYFAGKSASTKRTKVDPETVNLVQLDTIKMNIDDSADVAVINTDAGEIMAQLYTEYAPKTVARFKELADSGYYNGTYIYEIYKSFDEESGKESKIYFAGGSPYNDGTLKEGYNKDDEKIEQEFSKDLWPFKGSFMSQGLSRSSFFTSSQTIYGGSRFMVAGSLEFTDDMKKQLLEGKDNTKIEEAFIEYGGIPNASQQMTVFAQTFYGFDTIDKILNMKSDSSNSRPLEEIKIQKAEVCKFIDVKEKVKAKQ